MIFKKEYIKSTGFLFFYKTKEIYKGGGFALDKDKNRDCSEKFLKFLYKLKGSANKESREKGPGINNHKLKDLINKIIGDIEIFLEFYED